MELLRALSEANIALCLAASSGHPVLAGIMLVSIVFVHMFGCLNLSFVPPAIAMA